MAKAIVKCLYCGEQFDRNDPSNHFIKIGRRYAHQRCANEYNESLTQEQKDLNALIEYIKDLLKEDYNFMKVKKQIEDYHKKYDYSYSGMLRSLKWFYELKGNSREAANGGIGNADNLVIRVHFRSPAATSQLAKAGGVEVLHGGQRQTICIDGRTVYDNAMRVRENQVATCSTIEYALNL